uniref:Uncharacterized protein n=1 Tax=Oryza nivara TaxID=4536 RepID=A0A0E0FLB8_ORYNI
MRGGAVADDGSRAVAWWRPRPDGGSGLHLRRLCWRRLQPRLRLRPRLPAATYASTSVGVSPRLPAAKATDASLTSATDHASRRIRPPRGRGCADLNARYRLLHPHPPATSVFAVECLFEILRRLPGGCKRGASTCVSRSWFVMEDDELSASVPLL